MSTGLSRRGLLRAFAIPRNAARSEEGGAEPTAMVARIGEACVEPKGVACRRCGEACEADAIRFRPMLGGRVQPLLDAQACSGCAACLPVCPVQAIALMPAERAALVGELVELGRSA